MTDDTAPAPVPGRPLVMSFSSRSVNLSWTPAALMSGSGPELQQYVILVRRGENTSWDDSQPLETNVTDTMFTVTRLHPFTVYSFKVEAMFVSGVRTQSEESYYMITLREVPSGSPTITMAHNTSSNSLYLVRDTHS